MYVDGKCVKGIKVAGGKGMKMMEMGMCRVGCN